MLEQVIALYFATLVSKAGKHIFPHTIYIHGDRGERHCEIKVSCYTLTQCNSTHCLTKSRSLPRVCLIKEHLANSSCLGQEHISFRHQVNHLWAILPCWQTSKFIFIIKFFLVLCSRYMLINILTYFGSVWLCRNLMSWILSSFPLNCVKRHWPLLFVFSLQWKRRSPALWSVDRL